MGVSKAREGIARRVPGRLVLAQVHLALAAEHPRTGQADRGVEPLRPGPLGEAEAQDQIAGQAAQLVEDRIVRAKALRKVVRRRVRDAPPERAVREHDQPHPGSPGVPDDGFDAVHGRVEVAAEVGRRTRDADPAHPATRPIRRCTVPICASQGTGRVGLVPTGTKPG